MKSKKRQLLIVLADLMTVLMVIFLFIAVTYMVIKRQDEKKEIR